MINSVNLTTTDIFSFDDINMYLNTHTNDQTRTGSYSISIVG